MKRQKSEFGKGLGYNLGLFLAHQEHWAGVKESKFEDAISVWFNAAADHFYEFQPEYAPEHLQERCRILQDKCLAWRLTIGLEDKPTLEDQTWALQEAKDLLRLLDKHHGIPTIKGDWE